MRWHRMLLAVFLVSIESSADVSQGVTMDLLVSTENNELLEDCPREMSDAALVSTAKCGDTDAFVELTRRHSRRLLQTTYRITKNRQDAEDALQDSFLKAFSHLDNFQEKASFSTWLTRIAINSALMIRRKKRGHCEIPIDGSDDSGGTSVRWDPESPTEDPESCFAATRERRIAEGGNSPAAADRPGSSRAPADKRIFVERNCTGARSYHSSGQVKARASKITFASSTAANG